VTKKIDCDVFQDQLDALQRRALPDDGLQQLQLHARSCPDCGMLLKLHEHLLAYPLGDLEAAVPDELVASVWPRVQADVATHESTRLRESRGWQGWGWLVPAMAAATLLLFIASGFLFKELRQVRQREGVLVQQIAEQERWLAELDLRSAPSAAARTAALAGSRSWQRMLSRMESVSVSDLNALVEGLPARTTILTAAEAERLVGRVPYLRSGAWKAALAETRIEDGIQAGELLRLLESLDVDPDRTIPTTRISELLRGTGRS